MNTIKINSGKTLMIAHRGLSGIEKENTNASFIAAGNRSYFGIETDVHVTIDGKFVAIHDDTTGRVAIDNLVVEKSTFDTLRRLNLADTEGKKGREDLHIPTLQEYIATCKRYEKKAVLELKNSFTKEDIGRVCDVIVGMGYLENVIFISFDFDNLVKLRELYPGHPAQFLAEVYDESYPALLSEHQFGLDIEYKQLNKERIDALHAKGVEVNCWICNDKEFAERLCEYGIDYITSDILESCSAS